MMKTFLETWLAELPPILHRELSNQAELVPAEHLLSPATAICLGILIGGTTSGRFRVTVDRNELQNLFVEGKVTESEPDGHRDYELWRGLLHQVATVAVQKFGGVHVLSIEDTTWSLGLPSVVYELRLGNARTRLAFIDEVRLKTEGQVIDTAAIEETIETSGKITHGGVDRLLDVELEASLRFGSREMSLNDVLDLGPGDVVELDRHVTAPVDFLVGDKIVARGEVVLVNGSFGLRVNEVAEPKKCLESIRCLF
jgi:flagellar motor switch protein FliN